MYSGVAALGLAIGFIVTAANAADFQQRAGTGTGTVNNLSARDSAAATSVSVSVCLSVCISFPLKSSMP